MKYEFEILKSEVEDTFTYYTFNWKDVTYEACATSVAYGIDDAVWVVLQAIAHIICYPENFRCKSDHNEDFWVEKQYFTVARLT